MNTPALLKKYASEGFLFHGSPRRFNTVEPRQGNDSSRVAGNHLAVYATNDERVALVAACIHPTNPNNWTRSHHREDGGTLQVGGENICLGSGYIYILPPDTFQHVCPEDENEFVSFVSVNPFTIIEVTPSLLKELDILIPASLL